MFLEDEYILDIQGRLFFKIAMNLQQISKQMDDKTDAFFIILRRNNSKYIALNFLTNLIITKSMTIMNLSYIFRNLFEIYKKSLINDQINLKESKNKMKENNSENKENKLENGYTVINQADCYRYIFKFIIEEKAPSIQNFDYEYLIMIMIQFIREALGFIKSCLLNN